MGMTYASSSWINFWFINYYKGISKASSFIANVDRCAEASANDRLVWKAQARACAPSTTSTSSACTGR